MLLSPLSARGAAVFESGHAYGKALSTVKSCVGSTWCRYGVQDFVSFAVRVENRYKGVRSLTSSRVMSLVASVNVMKPKERISE